MNWKNVINAVISTLLFMTGMYTALEVTAEMAVGRNAQTLMAFGTIVLTAIIVVAWMIATNQSKNQYK